MLTLALLACAHTPAPVVSDYWSDREARQAVLDAAAELQQREATLSQAQDLGREARSRCASAWAPDCGVLQQQIQRVAASKRHWEDASTDYLQLATSPSVSRKRLRELQVLAETAQHSYEAEVLRLLRPARVVLGGSLDARVGGHLAEEAAERAEPAVAGWSASMR